MDIKFSSRVASIEPSATSGMTAKAEELRTSGKDVLSLSQGEPDFPTPEFIASAAKETIDSGKFFSYPPSAGYLDLRQAIANKYLSEYNLNYQPENVVVTNGAKQALSNLMLAVLDEGDEVIVLAPYWVSHFAQVKIAGGNPVVIKGKLENGFKIEVGLIEKAITPKTRAIVFSSPCNPTGLVYSNAELRQIANLVSRHPNLIVVADEIYEHINYTQERTCFASLPGMFDRTITINGFSKSFAMTGWRVGFLCAPGQIARQVTKLQSHLSSANCSIAQRAALAALSHQSGAIDYMVKEYKERRDLILSLLTAIEGVEISKPQGAFYVFPDVSSYYGLHALAEIRNSQDMCDYLLSEAHVSVVPGRAFGDDNCIRISYASSAEVITAAMIRIKRALEKLTLTTESPNKNRISALNENQEKWR